MSTQRLRLAASNAAAPEQIGTPALRDMRPLGQILVEMGAISEDDLSFALAQQRRLDAPLGDILISNGRLDAAGLQAALAEQHALRMVDFETDPPDPRCTHLLPPTLCVQHQVIPWLQLDDVLLVATARPDLFSALEQDMPRYGLTLLPVLAEAVQIQSALTRHCGKALVQRAEQRVDESLSCRTWHGSARTRHLIAGAMLASLTIAILAVPGATLVGLTALAFAAMVLSLGLKTAATLAELRHQSRPTPARAAPAVLRLPKVSVLVPLLRERDIASALIRRLSALTYPKSQLDVILVLETEDTVTRETLARTDLPAWVRVIVVPPSDGLLTKPRALNYALDFCHGSIVGIWDAEDAPAPDQIETVVARFHEAPPEVVCLQGRLDYYNAKGNWIARCFTIEYAMWWRLVMPGLARLGAVIPLGGTTLFFRRAVLESLGGWDAHNVTEDADLGLRLARHGYRTELIDTVTWEEASCRPWAWVKQRSRWLKGFAVTWLVHMRAPRRLLRELGLYRFALLQVFFAVALAPFLFAPVFWVYLLLPVVGAAHPAAGWPVLPALLLAFALAELTGLALHLIAVRRPAHRHLRLWTLLMPFYFMLGTVAVYKALFELVVNPFYWEKTRHGVCPTVRYNLLDPRPWAARRD